MTPRTDSLAPPLLQSSHTSENSIFSQQGYQITQQRHPIASSGFLEYMTSDEVYRRADIKQVQIEQDSGKSIHDNKDGLSFICLNRAGLCVIINFYSNVIRFFKYWFMLAFVLIMPCSKWKTSSYFIVIDLDNSFNMF